MKIIHVITAFGIGGAEKLLLNTINRQVVDNEIYLVYLKKIDVLLPQLNKKVIVKNIPLSFLSSKKLRKYFKKINPDIIHTHLGHADLLGIWSARKLNIKVFCTMHNIYFKKSILDKVFFAVYRFLFLNVSKNIQVISISKSVENHVINTLKIPNEQSHLLLNAIPPIVNSENKEKLKVDLKIPSNKLILLFVGRLSKQKSVETLLNSVEELKKNGYGDKFELLIVGDGNLRKSLEILSVTLNIKDLVRFEGNMTNIDKYYSIADIFILPSVWEGFGMVILEAFRAKIPVITSNIEGPGELVSNHENGLLFKPKDHLELSKNIVTLLENVELRAELGQKGYETFTKQYHIDNYVKKLNSLYKVQLND